MQYPQLAEKALLHFEKKMPFVLYSLPDSSEIIGVFQKDSNLYLAELLDESAFVLAPFDTKGNVVQIPKETSDIEVCKKIPVQLEMGGSVTIGEDETDKKLHTALISKAIASIKSGYTQKIVVSRKKELHLKEFDLLKLTESLFSQNPSAFRYIWYHPETSLWCGATPEILLKTNGTAFSTMALAGTQKIDKKSIIFWEKKEKKEQQWVVDAIVENLLDKTTALNVSKTQTHFAGDLAHLRTDIRGVLTSSKQALKKVVTALHPTPAVCGTPTVKAQNFIAKNEAYDREFYTGFLGMLDSNTHTTELFVNLRCIKIEGTQATLYVGGGITEDSQPEAEWEETHHKLQTMAKVLQPLL
jgi:isochorismate synthase